MNWQGSDVGSARTERTHTTNRPPPRTDSYEIWKRPIGAVPPRASVLGVADGFRRLPPASGPTNQPGGKWRRCGIPVDLPGKRGKRLQLPSRAQNRPGRGFGVLCGGQRAIACPRSSRRGGTGHSGLSPHRVHPSHLTLTMSRAASTSCTDETGLDCFRRVRQDCVDHRERDWFFATQSSLATGRALETANA
jgi:hypothetical protein